MDVEDVVYYTLPRLFYWTATCPLLQLCWTGRTDQLVRRKNGYPGKWIWSTETNMTLLADAFMTYQYCRKYGIDRCQTSSVVYFEAPSFYDSQPCRMTAGTRQIKVSFCGDLAWRPRISVGYWTLTWKRTSSMLNGLIDMQNSMNKHKSSILEIKSFEKRITSKQLGVVRIDCIVSCSTKEEIHRVVLFAFGRDWLYLTESKLCLRSQRNWFIVRKLLGIFMITSC